ncbi:uncharacterized protein [Clytia hemisphaerica]
MPRERKNKESLYAQQEQDEKDWKLTDSKSNISVRELLESSSQRFKQVEQLNNTSELENKKRQNRSLQRKLKEERHQYNRQIQDMKDKHEEIMEKMKNSVVKKVKEIESEYERKLGEETKNYEQRIEILQMDLEELASVLEDRNKKIGRLELMVEDKSDADEGLQEQIEVLQAELIKKNKRIKKMITCAESTKQMIKEVEEESLVVLNENRTLKYKLKQMGGSSSQSSFSDVEGVQRHPSLCDLDLHGDEEGGDGGKPSGGVAVGEFVLPDKFNFDEIIRKSLKKL